MTATVAAEETTHSPAGRSYPGLDTLRAVGALAVVGTHASFWSGAYTSGTVGTLLARLDVGVALFFVLSGFLLSRPFLDRRERGLPGPPAGRYLWKRFLRVYPPYVVAVVAAYLLIDDNAGASAGDWFTSLALADLYTESTLPQGLTQMWSLATEAAFYLVLPLLLAPVLTCGRGPGLGRRLLLLLAAMAALSVLWPTTLAARIPGGLPTLQWLPGYLTWFGAGIALAAADVVRHSRPWLRTPALVAGAGRSPGACWVAALALLAVAATPVAGPALLLPPTAGEAVTKNLLYTGVATLMVLPAVYADQSGSFARVLALRPLRHLGHISYGIFSLHLVLLDLIVNAMGYPLFRGGGWELFGLTVLASVVAAEVLYRVVELPALRLRDMRAPWSSAATSSATDNRAPS